MHKENRYFGELHTFSSTLLSNTIYCHFVDDLVKELVQDKLKERSNDSNSDVLEKYLNESKAKCSLLK